MFNFIFRGLVFAVFFHFVLQLKYSTRPPKLPNTPQTKKQKEFIKNILYLFNFMRRINNVNDTLLQEIFSDNGTLLEEDIVVEWFAHGMYTANATRRDKGAAIKALLNEGKEKKREESFYEPYWKSGEWVFLRTGTPTTSPRSTYWVDDYNYHWPMETSTVLVRDVYRECDRSCSSYFDVYGEVCGHRYSTQLYKYEYRDFDSVCDIELANCVNKSTRPMWHPLYRGKCVTNLSENFPYETQIEKILENKMKLDPFTYSTTTEGTTVRDLEKERKEAALDYQPDSDDEDQNKQF